MTKPDLLPDEVYIEEVDKNTVYMSGASPVRGYDRPITHPLKGPAVKYIRADLVPQWQPILPTLTPELVEEIIDIAIRAEKKYRSGCRGQTITMWDSFDTWVIASTLDYIRANLPKKGNDDV